jgi:hypothetical protein
MTKPPSASFHVRAEHYLCRADEAQRQADAAKDEHLAREFRLLAEQWRKLAEDTLRERRRRVPPFRTPRNSTSSRAIESCNAGFIDSSRQDCAARGRCAFAPPFARVNRNIRTRREFSRQLQGGCISCVH